MVGVAYGALWMMRDGQRGMSLELSAVLLEHWSCSTAERRKMDNSRGVKPLTIMLYYADMQVAG